MKENVIIFITVIFLCILSPTYSQWEKSVIDNDINSAVVVDIADIDGDSKLDLVVTHHDGLMLYQNNFPQWIRHTIDEVDPTFAFNGDMDGDGLLDVVTTSPSIIYIGFE